MSKTFHLQSFNKGWPSFWDILTETPPKARLSTISLIPHIGEYETCIFVGSESEVIDRYFSMDEAIKGHQRYTREYNLQLSN